MLRNIILCLAIFSISCYATSQEKPTLTVYTYNSFIAYWGPGDPIKQRFEAICDCQIKYVGMGDGVTILNRLKLEGARTKADVVIGLDNNLINNALKSGFVVPHQLPKPDNLTIDWWSDTFIPYDHGYFAFIYDQTKIKTPPTSLQELINNDKKWSIIYQDPRTSTPGLGLLLWMQKIYGDNVEQAWQQLAKNTLTVTKGWSEAYGLFRKGETDFVLSYTTSPAVHVIYDNDDRYKATVFAEGNYQQIEVANIVKYTEQFDLAQQFLAFLLSPQSQLDMVEKNIMYPVIDIELPPAFAELEKVKKVLAYSAEEVEQNQKQWIKQWQNAVSQ